MRIIRLNSNDCGGFKPPKGHLDTQLFPECEGYDTDRDVVKKNVKRKKKDQKKSCNCQNGCDVLAKRKSPMDHGFMDQCIKENQDKDDPGAYCAAIVDKAKGTTKWREKSKSK